jgi:hypothetical protein
MEWKRRVIISVRYEQNKNPRHKAVLDPVSHGILYRVLSARVYENEIVSQYKKRREGEVVLCLDGLSALPDLLCDVLYRNDRIGLDYPQKILFEKGIARSGEMRADSRV